MDLYTLTPGFMPKDIIGDFASAIWTERYFEAGDVELVTPASSEMMRKLAKGTFLGLKGTKEIMILDNQSIEDGLMTVTGQTLVKFLDQRPAWFEKEDATEDQPVEALTADTTAGQLISAAVDIMVVNPPGFNPDSLARFYNLNWLEEKIPGLELGRVDTNGAVQRLTINLGALYNSIQSLGQEEGVGIKLYLESSHATDGPVLKFATYRGKNRTSDQDVHSIVRLTPKMDSLTEVKEVSSISNYKNVLYVVYKGMTVHYAEPTLPVPVGFDRRVMVVQADDIVLDETRYEAYREQVARDTFANNNYVHTVDGQASPQGIYQYRVDYDLGDIIELEGVTGTLSKARITEYIRSQDKAGEREYPTLAVVDHLSTGTIPDTEPDTIDPPGTGDPEFEEPETPSEPEPEPEPEPDPNPDPEPDFDKPPENGDGDGNGDGEPPYTGPNPDSEPYTVTSSEDGILVTDTFPPHDPGAFPSGYYTIALHSRVKVHFPEGPENSNRYHRDIAGPLFKFIFSDEPTWAVDNGPYYNPTRIVEIADTAWDPETGEYRYGSGSFIDHSPGPWNEAHDLLLAHTAYFSMTIHEYASANLQLAPISIPKYPDNRLVSVQRFNSGTILWTPIWPDSEDEVIQEWTAEPESGDIWWEFIWHPY